MERERGLGIRASGGRLAGSDCSRGGPVPGSAPSQAVEGRDNPKVLLHGLQETSQEPWCPPGVPTQVPTPMIPGDRPRVRLGQWAGGCPGEVQPHCGHTGRRVQGELQDSCSSSTRTVLWPSQGHGTVHWEASWMPGGKERVAGTREVAA